MKVNWSRIRDAICDALMLSFAIALYGVVVWAASADEAKSCRTASYEDGEQIDGYCSEVLGD